MLFKAPLAALEKRTLTQDICSPLMADGTVRDARPCIHHGERAGGAGRHASFPNAGARAEQQLPFLSFSPPNSWYDDNNMHDSLSETFPNAAGHPLPCQGAVAEASQSLEQQADGRLSGWKGSSGAQTGRSYAKAVRRPSILLSMGPVRPAQARQPMSFWAWSYGQPSQDIPMVHLCLLSKQCQTSTGQA
ncbi:hypothetical protein Q7C36_007787 [Tachysurus vachellii]|uniref:Uncharacterized protein n=1 Tax=Tachysurus vachellii TaxID=175792 RepID=A0AA88SZT8_TACVA|nr:hypothetical protein Q7C36_007787 [Tachysurus vachellii]